MRDRRSPVARGRSRPDGERPERQRASAESNTLEDQCHPRKVFVGGLAHKTTTQHLRDHFGRFGPIVDAVVLRWPDGRSRGFGYVTFADNTAACSVLRETHSLSGRDVDVKRAVPGTNKLFVGGLPQNTTANELRKHFETFGVVSDAVVMIDPATSRSRGFGFVCFLPGQEGSAAVASSLQQYDNHRIRGKWIEVKSAAPPHKLATKNGGQDGAAAVGKVVTPADYEYEELSLAGALQGMSRPTPSPSPSIENREPNQRKGAASALGSPRKVALPANADMDARNPLQSPPPGLGAPGGLGAPAGLCAPDQPWWPSPWSPGFAAPGFAGFPPFAGGWPPAPVDLSHFEGSGIPDIGSDYFRSPQCLDPSGVSAAESLQRNLEQFLRQSSERKMGGHSRNPSVSDSTTCSAATQNEIAQAAAMLP